MKINFRNQTVLISAAMSFQQMGMLEDTLQTAALQAVEDGDAGKVVAVTELGDFFGIDLEIDIIDQAAENQGDLDLDDDGLPEPAPKE